MSKLGPSNGHILNFFDIADYGYFHSTDCLLLASFKWCILVLSLVNILFKNTTDSFLHYSKCHIQASLCLSLHSLDKYFGTHLAHTFLYPTLFWTIERASLMLISISEVVSAMVHVRCSLLWCTHIRHCSLLSVSLGVWNILYLLTCVAIFKVFYYIMYIANCSNYPRSTQIFFY